MKLQSFKNWVLNILNKIITNSFGKTLENEGEYGVREQFLPYTVLIEHPIDQDGLSLWFQESLRPKNTPHIMQCLGFTSTAQIYSFLVANKEHEESKGK